jgi:hypothetical protein
VLNGFAFEEKCIYDSKENFAQEDRREIERETGRLEKTERQES